MPRRPQCVWFSVSTAPSADGKWERWCVSAPGWTDNHLRSPVSPLGSFYTKTSSFILHWLRATDELKTFLFVFFWASFRLIQLECLPFLPLPKGGLDLNGLAQQNPNRERCELMLHTIIQGRKPEPWQMDKETKIQGKGYNHEEGHKGFWPYCLEGYRAGADIVNLEQT